MVRPPAPEFFPSPLLMSEAEIQAAAMINDEDDDDRDDEFEIEWDGELDE